MKIKSKFSVSNNELRIKEVTCPGPSKKRVAMLEFKVKLFCFPMSQSFAQVLICP